MDDEDVLGSDNSVQEWSDAVAETTSTPAGGAVAALATALAASLVAMVAGMTIKREKYAAVHDHARDTLQRAEQLRNDLLDMACKESFVEDETGIVVLEHVALILLLTSQTDANFFVLGNRIR